MTADLIVVGGQSFAAPGTGVLTVNCVSVTATSRQLVSFPIRRSSDLAGGVLNAGTLDTNGNSSRFNWSSGSLGITGIGGLNIDTTGPLGSSFTINSNKALSVTNVMSIGTTTAAAVTQTGGTVTVGSYL